ncbi:MAG TPA: AAA family ATPase [Thermoanaerobaculia bacterium]|nr:AAA family ATPase [Thermoanaerobaculia bacterium]
MHVSRLYIENFRSIERLDLTFRPGVNILVGRNNGGKSNIVRALDVLLGEHSPTYEKGEVITSKDFRSERKDVDGPTHHRTNAAGGREVQRRVRLPVRREDQKRHASRQAAARERTPPVH